ncbi:MAG: DUF2628 domain-containing protein [Reyranella sp.]|nr:DUF2628 domain-containing protein [Reyranella sp.]
MVLPTYRLDKLDSDESVVIDHWSYFWAALDGPFYLLSRGFYRLAAVMAAITLALAVLAFLGLLISVQLFDASIAGMVAMLASVAGALLLNGIAAVQLAYRGYLRSGWKMGY